MSKSKRILAVLLSVIMIASVVCVHTVASDFAVAAATENASSTETLTKHLIDFSTSEVATNISEDAWPSGIYKMDYEDFSYNSNISVDIAEDNGEKFLKFNYDQSNNVTSATTIADRGRYNDIFLKVSVPFNYIKYVESFEVDMIYNYAKSTGGEQSKTYYILGIGNGNGALGKSTDASHASFERMTEVQRLTVKKNITDLGMFTGDNYKNFLGDIKNLSSIAKWDLETAHAQHNIDIIIMVSPPDILNATDRAADYYFGIKDVSITFDAAAEKAINKDISVLDIEDASVGSAYTGANVIPEGIYGISAWTPDGCGLGAAYSGKQQIVKANGKNAWKINFNKSAVHHGWLWGSSGLYGMKINVPKAYTPYITKVNIEIENHTAGELIYRLGVTDGTNYGTNSANGYCVSSEKGDTTLSLNMSDIFAFGDIFAATHNGTSQGSWGNMGYDVTQIYFIASDSSATEGGSGYIVIKDITFTIETGVIKFNQSNVHNATVENGRVKIPASASEQEAYVTIPSGLLTAANVLNYQISSTSNKQHALKFFTNTITDSELSGYIKRGENVWQYSINANSKVVNYLFDFYGVDGGTSCVRTFDGTWYVYNWQPNTSIHPTATEKSNITKIFLGVNGVEDASGYIYIDSISYTEAGVKFKSKSATNGTVNIIDSLVEVGEKGRFVVTPNAGYYVKSLEVYSSLMEKLEYDVVSSYTGDGILYEVTAPEADVIIKPVFEKIDVSMQRWTNYYGNKFVADFTIPKNNNSFYNQKTSQYSAAKDYGMYVSGTEALAKYGYTIDDLTPEFVNELFETGHHLSKYIYKIDAKTMSKDETGREVRFTVDMKNITFAQRRTPIVFVNYITFADSKGNATNSVCEYKLKTLDALVYGDDFKDEFSANRGINYTASATADISVWQDIKSQGFDHIRMPATFKLDDNGKLRVDNLHKLDYAINSALKTGFPIVLDAHGLPVDLCGNYAGNVDTIYSWWKQIAKRYAYLPNSVAFEFMNEPNTQVSQSASQPDPISGDELMTVMNNLVINTRAIKGNGDRYLVLSNNFNGDWAISEYTNNSYVLNHKNLILDIHYYGPMSFSHSGCFWITNSDGSLTYPYGATYYSLNDIKSTMNNLKNIESKYGVMVWLGEWGAYAPDSTAKVNYFRDITNQAEANGISWCLWEYGAGWSPYVNGVWNQALLDAMFK